MMPHTRRGHIRRYSNGNEVYVKASVIHKEKYEGFQSAHRINKHKAKSSKKEMER